MSDAPRLARLAVVLIAMLTFGASQSSAQRAPTSQKVPAAASQPPPEPPAPSPEPAPSKLENPGLLNELGKLFVRPADLFPGLKLSPDATAPIIPQAQPEDVPVTAPPAPAIATPAPPPPAAAPVAPATATIPAKPVITALVPQMMRGRSSCPVSANGAPDCKAAADKLCQDSGFAAGISLDTDSAQTCSTKALLAGARRIKDICRTETFVTRAMCQ